MIQRLAVLALALTVTSCATKKYIAGLPLDSGIKVVYAGPFDKVKRSCYDALSELSYTVKEEKWDQRGDKTWSILASQGLAAGTAGRYCRVVIQQGEKEQQVWVVLESKANTRGSAAQDEDDAKAMHARIEKRVASK